MVKKTVALLSLGIMVACVVAFVGAQESSRRTRSAPNSTYERSALADRLRAARDTKPAISARDGQPMPAIDAQPIQPIQPIPETQVTTGAVSQQLSDSPASLTTLPSVVSSNVPTPAGPPPSNPQPVTDLRGTAYPAPSPADSPIVSSSDMNVTAPAIDSNPIAPLASTPATATLPTTLPFGGPTPAQPAPTIPSVPRPQGLPNQFQQANSPTIDTTRLAPTSARPMRPAPANRGPAYNTAMLNGANGTQYNEGAPVQQPPTNARPETNTRPVQQQPLTHSELQTTPGALMQIPGPAITLTTEGPRAVVVGKRGSYVITLKNHGRDAANEVKVRFSIPASVRLDDLRATTGSAEDVSQDESLREFVWTVGKIAGNDTEDLELQVTPTENRPFAIEADWSLQSEAKVARIEVQQPILRLNVVGPREMLFGTTNVFTVVLTNPGTGPAENVTVDLGAGTAQAGSKKIGRLAAGEKREMELELTPRDVGVMEIHARATGDSGLQTEALHEVAVRRAELNVAVKGPSKKFAGSPGDYIVTVTNTGDATANNVVVNVSLPRGAEYVSGIDGVQSTDGKIQFNAGALAAGTAKTYEIRCLLNDPGEVQFAVGAQGDGDLTAATSLATKVEAIADLRLVVHDPRGPIPTGREVTYELHITNRGTAAANDVQVIAQFSEGIEPTQATGQAARLLEDGQVLFETIRRIGQGESIVLKVNAKAVKGGLHRFRAELTCTDPETRLVTEDSTKYFENE